MCDSGCVPPVINCRLGRFQTVQAVWIARETRRLWNRRYQDFYYFAQRETIMTERMCIIGLDSPEYSEIHQRLALPMVAHETLPRIVVRDGQLLVAARNRTGLIPVSLVVFHGIFEDDLDAITALALWGGPCLPNAHAMMDCRLKFPCLVRALQHTQFGAPLRGYAGPHTPINVDRTHVAKWGNWHCGENKECFTETWNSEHPSIIEPFLAGQSVRIVVIGEQSWQIKLEGTDWRKSIHDPQAAFMDVDAELLADTHTIQQALGLEIVANDYIVTEEETKHLLEVNHIPNVTRFPAIWEAYRDYVVQWVQTHVASQE